MFNFKYNPRIKFDPKNFRKYADSVLGKKLWNFLTKEEVVKRMAYFVDAKVTPVEGVDEEIQKTFNSEIRLMKDTEFDTYKQLIGRMIRAIMEAHGYEHAGHGYRVRSGKLFSLASKYKRKEKKIEP